MAVATRRRFGRRAVSDLRDLQYLLVDRNPTACAVSPTGPVRCRRGVIYDQGEAGLSVACSLLAALHAGPQSTGHGRALISDGAGDLDHRCHFLDGTTLMSETTSLRSGCRVLKELRLIEGYYWSYDLDEIVNYLGTGEGLVLGLDWYQAMSKPDETGLIRAWGRPEGGHAVFAFGVDPESRTVWIQNSWGEDWGGWSGRSNRRSFKGCAKLSYDDLRKLLADNGEAVALAKRAR
jgi:hypothetical protein